MNGKELINWLLSSDPSIRWQVKRDLLKETTKYIDEERDRISTEGWGKILLSLQDEDGKWSGQLYNGKWTSTFYTLLLLKDFGLKPNSKTQKACHQLFLGGIYNNEEIRFSNKQKLRDNGVTGMTLGILSYFEYNDEHIHKIADYLIRSQNPDGSWFFDNIKGVEKYCFENTMIILKGLCEYSKKFLINNPKFVNAVRKAHEFLLKHNLFQDPTTGLPLKNTWLKISFPNYWFYDILVALDYFRDLNIKDRRLEPAIEIIKKKQNKDGIWNLEYIHSGKTFFEMEQVGKPSRWNTLRSLRVIEWWGK